MQVTLYSRPGCHLCDDLKLDLAALHAEIAFVLTERNIDDDPADHARFQYLIPVLDIEGGPLLYPPHQRVAVATALHEAAEHPHDH
jgi:glutaredoxin